MLPHRTLPARIPGVLHCFDAFSLPGCCPATDTCTAATRYLNKNRVRIIDFIEFTSGRRERPAQCRGACAGERLQIRERLRTEGLMCLHDEPRPGRPRSIEEEGIKELLNKNAAHEATG